MKAVRSPARIVMGKSMQQERTGGERRNPWLAAVALTGLVAGGGGGARAQQPQFGQGFGAAGQAASRNPAESSAYAAAINQADPNVRVSAIQQFLIQYPNSPMRQPAIAQMMLAKRAAAAPNLPVPAYANRPLASSAANAGLEPVAAVPLASAQPAAGAPRDSLLQHPAKPAQVSVSSGSLTIKADNSSLSEILHDISATTGMKVEGLGQDERIFGSYGPGEQREVLLSLLEGSGYNVLMVGDDRGAPRELTLSQRSAANTVNSGTVIRNNHEEEDDEIEQEQPQATPEQALPVNPAPPGNPLNPDGTPQPRNPGEVQEMLRQRQQQQQQMQQQPPQ